MSFYLKPDKTPCTSTSISDFVEGTKPSKKQQHGNATSEEQGSSGDDGKNSPKPEKAAATAPMNDKEFIKKLIADQAELKKQIEALKASF